MKTLSKFILIMVLAVSILPAFAQPDTSTTQKLLQYIMQPLDKNQIPTGFLEEYGCPMLSAATFNGVLTDSNKIDMNLWRTLYLQLQTGWTRSTANPLPAISAVNTIIKQNISGSLPIPIPLLIAQYNTVKNYAFTNNLLYYNSSTKQVSDVWSRVESPYEMRNLFAACSNKKNSITGSETFIVQSNMIWNNTGKSINQIQIDFANGQGFQTITIGSPISISYTDTGFKKWVVKLTLTDHSILQCYQDYHVLKAVNPSARFLAPDGFSTGYDTFWNFPPNSTDSGGKLYIAYTSKNRTNTIRKPLIVVEGYDVNRIAPSLQNNYGYGDIITAINEPRSNIYDFNNNLDALAGYDLIFIDFLNGTDDIVRNAAFVQRVINEVNLVKVLNNNNGNIREQNVVMGLSMGGLCARYALANMTKNFPSTPTETRLLITHDSPHKGANIPLGLQYMIRMLGGVELFGYNVYDIYPEYDDAIGLLSAPATTQLLLYRATSANTFVNNSFLDNTYRPMITFASSGPQPSYRFIATANGNECANALFNPGKTFINLGSGISAGIDARFLFFSVPVVSYRLAAEVEAYALPNTGSTNKIARVYTINNLKLFGFIDVFKQLYNNTAYAPGNHLAVDGVPGSNYPLLDVSALSSLTNLTEGSIRLSASFALGPVFTGYFGIYAYNAGVSYNFTFIPVASALDVAPYIANTFTQKYANGTNQNYPSSSETFIAQETVLGKPDESNNTHIRFTPRNSRWLFNEMENLPNTENCSSECNNNYYISGADRICFPNAYTIPGLQRGASITWSISPSSGIVSSSIIGNTITLTKIASGDVTLSASLNGACTNNISSKIIKVGTALSDILVGYSRNNALTQYIDFGSTNSKTTFTQTGNFRVQTSSLMPGSNTFSWTRISGNSGWSNYSSNNGICNFTLSGPNAPTIVLKTTLTNTLNGCTSSNDKFVVFVASIPLSGRVIASPNPTKNDINITFAEPLPLESTSTNLRKEADPMPLRSVNSTGKTIISLFEFNTSLLVKEFTKTDINSKSYPLNLAGLRKGLYIMQVDRNNQTSVTKIIIE